MGGSHAGARLAVTAVAAFAIAFLGIIIFRDALPKDQGRKFAVNGALSEGKPRGAGIILIFAASLSSVLLVRLTPEIMIYLLLCFASMLTGYLDDAAEKPWSELKKGVLDLVISAATTATYIYFNSTEISFATLGISVKLPVWLFAILGTILVWAAINVTNCSDGVDGLCGSLSIITLLSALALIHKNSPDKSFEGVLGIFVITLLAYLWFNASPSKILMGDGGSRPLGVLIAIAFMRSASPVMFIPCAAVIILDGGLGLVKLSAIRYLKLKNFLKNIRTPFHDHLRKNKGWSDTQTVFRLCICQLIISAAFVALAVTSLK